MTDTQTKLLWVSVLLFKQLWLNLVLFLDCCDRSVTSMVTLSPMVVAPVCRVEDPLQITCTASVEFIIWSVLRVNEQGTLNKLTSDVIITSRESNHQIQSMVVNSATFTFMLSSAQGTSPLISILSINSVNIGLNGTVVNCSDVANPMISASTTIQIIDTSQNFQYTPRLSISEEHYEADGATVTVVWAQQEGITYTARVSRSVPIVSTGSTSHQLIILYNTEYNFSVEAVAPCRPNSMAFIVLNYINCGRPESLFNDSVFRVVGYNDLIPVEGSTITFSCPPGLVLMGPYSAMCTKNREWEPDPRGIMCNYDSSSLEGCTIKSSCPPGLELVGPGSATCTTNREWGSDISGFNACVMLHNLTKSGPIEPTCSNFIILKKATENSQKPRPTECSLAAAVSSSVLTFLIASIIIFIAGFMFGQHFRISKGTLHIITDHPGPQGPVYDYVQPASTTKHQENNSRGESQCGLS